ncbi:phage tail tape measure protein [Neorhizobium galegae]|uniref:phage tail tape measure protein n=1 Tax=Neorhizobium galegae TaxID=399 RepID=UPI000622A434|nr:phage tail tape measure protein [Neorhizobium galegae]CDZ45600.1 Putative phage tail tape measure protein, core region [Neorhizobium galegae bv. orientalis]
MNDMNVALKLRLLYEARNAKEAERDLKELKRAGDQLGRVKADGLGKGLAGVRREADRSEKAIIQLDRQTRRLNTARTDMAEREIKALGTAGKAAQRDLDGLEKKLRSVDGKKFQQMEKPASALDGTMLSLGKNAAGAIAGLAAFASVDNIVRGLEALSAQFRRLDRDVASVAVTAEMRTPDAIEKIAKSNQRLSIRYGLGQTEVNSARKSYAAAGFGLDQQEAILDPTLKAAKAGDSTGETMSQAIIAAQQNLGVKSEEVPAALDMMAKGSKLGSFEVDAMAKNFPALGTMLAGTGRSGLGGWAELVALAQVTRMGAGSQDEAAANLQNLIAKLTSKDTVDNFEKKGVSLPNLRKKAGSQGTAYLTAVMDEVMRLTDGDTFKIGELFGDQQAGLALKPLLANRAKYEDFLRQIMKESSGTVDADYDFLRSRPQERADRRGAALQATGDKVGSSYEAFVGPIKEWFVRLANSDYAIQERGYDETKRLGGVDVEALQADIAEREKRLGAIPAAKGDVDVLYSARQTLVQEIQQLKMELEAATKVQTEGKGPDLGKTTGTIPVPLPRPDQQLDKDMSGAAEKAMNGYNQTLDAAGDQAVQIAREKSAQIQDALTFTATPTIAPTFAPPTPSPAAGPDKRSSIAPVTNSKVTQYISSPNSKMAAIRARREQGRAIRLAMAGAYDDLGTRPA